MSNVTTEMIKNLRTMTGAGMMDCKNALNETAGNLDQAVEFLRKKGLASAAKKASRSTSEGLIYSYIHGGGKIGVMVEVNCETDFVARNDQFKELVHDLSLHIAAANPLYVKREDVPAAVKEKEHEVFTEQVRELKKPENVIEKIVEGKMDKYLSEICLLEQPFVKNPDQKVQDLITQAIATIGENITFKRFVRFEMGEDVA
ncbi:MAG: translation elongation factor Ts [Bdellovibrionota bacterium]|nr:translation elongation factor Ts [Deltaproteobacteria bacterium]